MVPDLLADVFEQSSLPTVVVDAAAMVLAANPSFLAMSRRHHDEVIGTASVDFMHPDDLAGALAGIRRLTEGAQAVRQRRRHRRGDDTWIDVDALTSLLPCADGWRLLVHLVELGAVDDVSSVRTEVALPHQPFGGIFCFHHADGSLYFASDNIVDLLGRPIEWFMGRSITDPALDAIASDGLPLSPEDDPILEAQRIGDDVVRTIGLRAATGSRVWLSVRAGIGDAGPRSAWRDVTELVEARMEASRLAELNERELSHRADHDSLTGLKDRRVVTDSIADRIAADEPVTVMFIDLDDFKAVNDRDGHLAGDAVLIEVAARLAEIAPPETMLGRMGGDEFIAVLDERADAERLAAALEGLVLTTPPRPPITASIGFATSRDGDITSDLLRRADEAMYRTKRLRPQPSAG